VAGPGARAVAAERGAAWGMTGLLLGAAGMFATMYSTQAILPELGRDFGAGPSEAGLTISVVVLAVAVAGWIWGPVSDRFGRKRSLMLASGLLVLPTLGTAVAPTFGWLLAFRALQGLCMPGLLTVGVPYVAEVFAPELGGRAMGYYTAALVAGGVLGRVGVGLMTAATSWRWAFAALAALPLAASVVMRRMLPEAPAPARSRGALAAQWRNRRLLAPTAAASTLFFTFVSIFSYVTYRLEGQPFGYGPTATSLVFALWALGAAGPVAGRLADRIGWRRVVLGALVLALVGLALSLPAAIEPLLAALAVIILAMFGGVTAAQLGLAAAGDVDRGVGSAIYFTFYYLAGALAGFLPGLAWQAWRWPGIVALGAVAVSVGLAAVAWSSTPPTPPRGDSQPVGAA
jgi:MFS transporter, YNFM family, putative membrane transport protein